MKEALIYNDNKYEDKWVALSNDEKSIVSYDSSFIKAFNKALESGEKKPVLIKVPSKSFGYIL